MNRRRFLGLLGAGAVAAKIAPLVEFTAAPVAEKTYLRYVMGTDAVIGAYADYANFSSLALNGAIDDLVHDCAVELGMRAGYSKSQLWAKTFDEPNEQEMNPTGVGYQYQYKFIARSDQRAVADSGKNEIIFRRS